MSVQCCPDIEDLCTRLRQGAGAAIIEDEALTPDALELLQHVLRQEPAWSDFPIIILTTRGEPIQRLLLSEDTVAHFGNITLLERPVGIQTLISACSAALRARRRQYQCRDLLLQREKSLERLDLLAEVANDFLLSDKPKEVVDSVFKKLASQFELEIYLNYLFDSPAQRLWLNSYSGIPHDMVKSVQFQPLSSSICGNAAQTRQVFVAEEIASSKNPQLLFLNAIGASSFVCFPLVANDELIGTLAFGSRLRPRFRTEELSVLGTISNQVAVAIQRKRTEEALYDLMHQLDQRVQERTTQLQETSDQMEAFCYSISHDLRAPLRSIRGFSQAILEDYSALLDSNGRDYLRRIMEGAEKMDSLIHDLLEYSRLGRSMLTFEPINLQATVQRSIAQFEDEIRAKNASISVESPLLRVQGHGPTVEQMIVNLLSNALKFVNPGVKPLIRIRSHEAGNKVRLWVEDNGIGIAPEHHARIFGVFERLHPVDTFPGTGIGLAIVSKAATRMGGRAGVESALGAGSRFWFELPKANSNSKANTPAVTAA